MVAARLMKVLAAGSVVLSAVQLSSGVKKLRTGEG